MKLFSFSFKTKLRIVILSVTVITLILALVSIGFFNVKKHRQILYENIKILAKSTAYNIKPALTFEDPASAEKILRSLNVSSDVLTATLFDESGEIFAQYNAVDLKKIHPPAITFNQEGTFFKQRLRAEYLEYYQPIKVNKKQVGTLLIQSSLNKVSAYIKEYIFISLIIIISSLPVILILSSMLQKIITKPLKSLSKTIYEIQQQADYSSRVKITCQDEMGRLMMDFNDMLDIIESRDQQLTDHQGILEKKINERTCDLVLAKDIAEKANQAKSGFLSNMSHELRTPMNAILGFSQLIAMDELSSEHKEYNDAIIKAGYHLLELIDKILDLSKIEAGYLELNNHPCTLNIILMDCINLIKPLADKRGIKLIYQVTQQSNCKLVLDSVNLNQVLINILSNAVKYNRDSGMIMLEQEKIEDMIKISITDTGKGLSEDQIERIFNPFERLDAAHSTIEGTGVGLTICEKIISAMNGDMGVYSTLGQGTTFWIQFPINQQ